MRSKLDIKHGAGKGWSAVIGQPKRVKRQGFRNNWSVIGDLLLPILKNYSLKNRSNDDPLWHCCENLQHVQHTISSVNL